MTEEKFNEAHKLVSEISATEKAIERNRTILKDLGGCLPELSVGCRYTTTLFVVDDELREAMKQHFQERNRRLELQIKELEIQFNNL